MNKNIRKTDTPKELSPEIRQLIGESRQWVATTVNAALSRLYWKIGERISREILDGKRADYGKQIVSDLGRSLVEEYGNSFSATNLCRMLQFYEVFPEEQIVVSLIRQLSWTHFIALIPLNQPFERDFYAEMCRIERWSVRTLRKKIDSTLYERTAISKKPDDVVKHEIEQLRDEDKLTPALVFRDPYFLDFLGIADRYTEKDLEDALLREIERLLLELGAGFSFIARQQRLSIGNEDFYIDLLFFNRKLNRLVAVDLKLSKFKAEYKGQMELYLRWLDKHEREPNEESPIGMILCTGKNECNYI